MRCERQETRFKFSRKEGHAQSAWKFRGRALYYHAS